MTEKQIDKIVEEILGEASSPASSLPGSVTISLGRNYTHGFIINNEPNTSSNLRYLMDSPSDAISIINKIMGEPFKTEEEAKETFKYDENSPLYLHYRKSINK